MSFSSCVHFNVGDIVKLSRERIGVIRYIGALQNKYGEFYGIELTTNQHNGKNNGSINGIFYFQVQLIIINFFFLL